MERITIIWSVLGVLCSPNLMAQLPQIEPQLYAVSPAGGDISFQDGSIEMQLGGVAIHTFAQDSLYLTQGTLQPGLHLMVGIGPVQSLPPIHIFPNPVQTYLHLDDPHQIAHEILLVNADGRIVGRWFPTKKAVYDTQNLAAGYYQFMVFNEEKFPVLMGTILKQGP